MPGYSHRPLLLLDWLHPCAPQLSTDSPETQHLSTLTRAAPGPNSHLGFSPGVWPFSDHFIT